MEELRVAYSIVLGTETGTETGLKLPPRTDMWVQTVAGNIVLQQRVRALFDLAPVCLGRRRVLQGELVPIDLHAMQRAGDDVPCNRIL